MFVQILWTLWIIHIQCTYNNTILWLFQWLWFIPTFQLYMFEIVLYGQLV